MERQANLVVQIHHEEKGSKSVAKVTLNLADFIEGTGNSNGQKVNMKLE
jgi:hypothetical protein